MRHRGRAAARLITRLGADQRLVGGVDAERSGRGRYHQAVVKASWSSLRVSAVRT